MRIQILGLIPGLEQLQSYSDKFRFKLKLFTQEETQKWLIENDLDMPAYNQLITMGANFDFIVLQNCLDVLNIENDDVNDIYWLYDAARLTNLYAFVRA